MVKVNYVDNKKNVVLFDIRDTVSDIKYCGLALRKSKKGEWFISEPSYKSKNGQYYKYYYLPDSVKERLASTIIIHLESNNYSVDSVAKEIFNF